MLEEVDGQQSKIDYLNSALKQFEEYLNEFPPVQYRVKVLMIECGGDAQVVGDWVDGIDFRAPCFSGGGLTPLGEAVQIGLGRIEVLKQKYKDERRPYTRPVMVIITDGYPTDDGWEVAAEDAQRAMAGKHVQVWPVAILPKSGGEGADLEKLSRFKSPNEKTIPIYDPAGFRQFFDFLGRALAEASNSSPGDAPKLIPYFDDKPDGPGKDLLF
jgi:uncharacterized protein YegL